MISVRPLAAGDASWKRDTLMQAWGATVVARRGELVDTLALDGFIVEIDGDRAGLLTYALQARQFEVVTIHVDREGIGAGRALMDAARARAIDLGATRMWLSTTNDNFRAFRFYQLWGMRLSALLVDGVAVSRRVKPVIPLASDGIAIRDEIEFELMLES